MAIKGQLIIFTIHFMAIKITNSTIVCVKLICNHPFYWSFLATFNSTLTHMKSLLLLLSLFSTMLLMSQPLSWNNEKIIVTANGTKNTLLNAENIFADGWDELAQARFWQKIMLLSPDSCIISVASNRQILGYTSVRKWESQSEIEKAAYKTTLKAANNIPLDERIYITTGKNDFYKFRDVFHSLSKGVAVFEKNGVDPWYAQSILLIESPGQIKKSVAGAYGAFQLMPSVAKKYGLIVTASIDERTDFDKSALAASKLISTVCIPEAKKILNRHNITYKESDLWFRLFVMHCYHAGAMNVSAVVDKIKPTKGSKDLILKMWTTTAASFGNNSQNYSQLILAAQIILNDMIYTECDDIIHCGTK